MPRSSFVVSVLVLGGCFSRGPDRRFTANVAQIDAAYAQDLHGINEQYRRGLRSIARLEQALVAVQPASHSAPTVRISERRDIVQFRELCDPLFAEMEKSRALGADTTGFQQLAEDCMQRHSKQLLEALVATYWAADIDWIAQTFKKSTQQINVESLFVYSHNLRLRAYIAARRQALSAARQEAVAELQRLRTGAIIAAGQLRDAEVSANQRQFAAAMAAAAEGMRAPYGHAGASQTYGQGSYGGAASGTSQGCSSDYACGMGQRCVKPYYSGVGYCAKAVNEYGVQSTELPRTDSVFVNVPDGADCKLLTDCPVGFSCDLRSGACVR